MNPAGKKKLEMLRDDYARTVGKPFQHFYCPILFQDEDVPLCRAHVINSAFPDSDRTQTVQREDVDSFFGSLFESDFVKLQYKGKHHPVEVLGDPDLYRKIRPKLMAEGQEVEYYPAQDQKLPGHHSGMELEAGDIFVRLGLKLNPTDTLAKLDGNWEFQIEQDLRLAALGSLLKAAHLTLFARLGYAYALSAGGHFMGHNILGTFYRANRDRPRQQQLMNAKAHFEEYVSLVRPVDSAPSELQGTLTDGLFHFCLHQGRPWAAMVLLKTGEHRHGVLVPWLEHVESAVRFDSFLKHPSQVLEVKRARDGGEHWDVSPESTTLHWPEASFD